jgi:glycosyltransferase involved in cell wall biosynthesis
MIDSCKSILIVSHAFAPESSSRTVRLAQICRTLQTHGWQVAVYTTAKGSAGNPEALSTRLFDMVAGTMVFRTSPGLIYGLSVQGIERRYKSGRNAPTYRRVGWNSRFRNWLSRRRLEPQLEWVLAGLPGFIRVLRDIRPVVVLSSSYPYAAHLLCRTARRLGNKFHWAGDFGDPLIGGGGHAALPAWEEFWKRIEKDILRQMEHVFVTTNRTRELYLELYPHLNPSLVTVIRNGFDPQDFTSAPVVRRPSSVVRLPADGSRVTDDGSRVTTFTMTYVGTLYHPRVSIVPFIQALDLLRKRGKEEGRMVKSEGRNSPFTLHPSPLRIRVVGQVDRDTADRLEPTPGVEFVGHVNFEQSLEEMQRADLLLLWDNQSGVQIPGKVYHYIGAGRPILAMVSSENGELAELLRPYPNARIVPNTATAIAEALDEMMQKAQESRVNCEGRGVNLSIHPSPFSLFQEQYTWDRQLGVLDDILSRLAMNEER